MYNCVLVRLSCSSVFRLSFCAGTCLGGVVGIVLGILERSSVGILGGMFFGLLFGLSLGLFALGYTAIFNLLSPVIGGLPVQIDLAPHHNKGREEPGTDNIATTFSPRYSNPDQLPPFSISHELANHRGIEPRKDHIRYTPMP